MSILKSTWPRLYWLVWFILGTLQCWSFYMCNPSTISKVCHNILIFYYICYHQLKIIKEKNTKKGGGDKKCKGVETNKSNFCTFNWFKL